MPDWLTVLIVIVVLVILLVAIWWWWTHRQPTVVSGPGAESAAVPAAAGAPGPYGPGSAAPLAGGAAPSGFAIKGNSDSMLYHSPESPYYGRTVAEVWFRSEADAQRAGFTRWDRNKGV